MIFGKLKNEREIEYFRPPLKVDDKDVFTNDKQMLLEHGFKEVVLTKPPETEEGFYAAFHYEENDSGIIRRWEILPLPAPTAEEQLEDAKNALDILGVN